MIKDTPRYPLPEAVVKYFHLSRFWIITAFTATLLLLLILFTYLDGAQNTLLTWSFWRQILGTLIIILYVLIVYPLVWRLRDRALQSLRPLLPITKDDYHQLEVMIRTPKRLWEWTAVVIGMLFTTAIGQPWNLPWESGQIWSLTYFTIMALLYWGLLGWLIYDTFAGIFFIYQLSRRDLRLDIFDTEQMTPIAYWSLGISLLFVGGISLSLIFANYENLLTWSSITTYSIMVSVTVLMFFLSMWSAHRAMRDAKNRKLSLTRRHLVSTSRELEEKLAQGELAGAQELSSIISSWAMYQRLIKESPTWPFNAGIIRRLIASTIIPIIVYLVKIISGLGIRL